MCFLCTGSEQNPSVIRDDDDDEDEWADSSIIENLALVNEMVVFSFFETKSFNRHCALTY